MTQNWTKIGAYRSDLGMPEPEPKARVRKPLKARLTVQADSRIFQIFISGLMEDPDDTIECRALLGLHGGLKSAIEGDHWADVLGNSADADGNEVLLILADKARLAKVAIRLTLDDACMLLASFEKALAHRDVPVHHRKSLLSEIA